MTKLPPSIESTVRAALKEDSSSRDVTSRLLFSPRQTATAHVIAKQNGVVCGVQIAAEVFRRADAQCNIRFFANDGDAVRPGQKIMTVTGKADRLLAAERTAINFLQHLSGISSLTRRFARAVQGTKAKILDTRKTIPGLRVLAKYAVKMGGGTSHRMNLSEAAMIKDNHHRIAGPEPIKKIRARLPKKTSLIIEAETIPQVRLALEAKADVVLLDNMPPTLLKKSVRFIRNANPKIQIEVSGGVTLKNVRQIARAGVDRISVGALTHSAPALDLSLEVQA